LDDGVDKKRAVIVDLDGTLASCEWRRHHVTPIPPNRHKDWNAFFAGIPCDAPVPHVVALLRALDHDIFRILVSARPDNYRYHTEWWLMEHAIHYDLLLMRSAGDTRHDPVVKREIYDMFIAPQFEVALVVDDRPQVVEMWRSIPLAVLQVTDPGLPPIVPERTT